MSFKNNITCALYSDVFKLASKIITNFVLGLKFVQITQKYSFDLRKKKISPPCKNVYYTV
jgi:hypothetical protein